MASQAKLTGYAALSRYMSEADGLHVFRRFAELRIRSLLFLQDDIHVLEDKLHARDVLNGEHGTWRRDADRARKGLIGKIRAKLKEYDEGIATLATMRSFESPKERPLRVLKGYIEAKRPLIEEEEPSFDDIRDLLCLKTWDDSFPTWLTEHLKIGDWTKLTEDKMGKSRFENLNIDTEGLQLLFISPTKIRRIMRVLVVIAGCLFLIVPIILLFFLQSDAAKLSIIVASLLLFSTITAALTSAKNWEVVAASIAYAAVLVVFVGSEVGQSRSNTT